MLPPHLEIWKLVICSICFSLHGLNIQNIQTLHLLDKAEYNHCILALKLQASKD